MTSSRCSTSRTCAVMMKQSSPLIRRQSTISGVCCAPLLRPCGGSRSAGLTRVTALRSYPTSRVNTGVVAKDDPVAFESRDPFSDRRCRQIHPAAKLGEAQPRVRLEFGEQAPIGRIEHGIVCNNAVLPAIRSHATKSRHLLARPEARLDRGIGVAGFEPAKPLGPKPSALPD